MHTWKSMQNVHNFGLELKIALTFKPQWTLMILNKKEGISS